MNEIVEKSSAVVMPQYSQLSNGFNDALNVVDDIVLKKYISNINSMELIPIEEVFPSEMLENNINDNVRIAKEMDADGVHVGQSDMEADDVRKILGEDKILGVSAQTVEQAVLAEKMGADYLGVGAVFSTSTKKDAADVSKETLKAICEAVNIPVIAIGGIGADNILSLQGSGICGIAVVSAIFAAKDIEAAAKVLKDRTEKMLK